MNRAVVRTIKVLFVCTGNICRSPTAEAVLRRLLDQAGLGEAVAVDSAGTHGYHVGQPPDGRTQRAAARRGYDLSAQRARQVRRSDLDEYDYVLAMDRDNLVYLRGLAGGAIAAELRLFLEYAQGRHADEVPDPYYGGAEGFDLVIDLVEQAAFGFVDEIKKKLGG